MKRSYDLIANIYDRLAMLFIGKSLRKAQVYLLPLIPANAKVLIVGGGTGWILEEITGIHKEGLQIDYLDVSEKMIAKSKQRNCGNNQVRFIHQSILTPFDGNNYDVVITPFLLDNFNQATAQKVFALLHEKLKSGALWLYTDFQVAGQYSFLHKVILRIMYSFFRMVANVEARQLPNVVALFANYQYKLVKNKTFLHHFIITAAYRKP